jgi:hypothetical protein
MAALGFLRMRQGAAPPSIAAESISNLWESWTKNYLRRKSFPMAVGAFAKPIGNITQILGEAFPEVGAAILKGDFGS